jgi:hypothetical protein
MPSSEDPGPAVRLTRSFWIGLIAGVVLLLSVAGFNVVVDPTGEFGLSGRFAFNRAPPPEVIAFGREGRNPAYLRRAIRESDATHFMIGTSRTERGFDTCGRPEVLGLSGSSWDLPEFRQVQDMVLAGRSRPVTLLMEVGLPTTLAPVIDDPIPAAISVALSPRTTLQALKTVSYSLSGRPVPSTYVPCRTPPTPPRWERAAINARYSANQLVLTPEALGRQERSLLAIADAADRICRRDRLRHTVIFYALPSTPPGSPTASQAQFFNRNSVRLAGVFARRPAAPGGCDVRFLNMSDDPPGGPAGQALWSSRANWLDYSHFSHRLGATALERLLSQDEAASATSSEPVRATARID